MEKLNNPFIVWEITPDYIFSQVYFTEEEAQKHVVLREQMITGTEMEGRNIFYKRYK